MAELNFKGTHRCAWLAWFATGMAALAVHCIGAAAESTGLANPGYCLPVRGTADDGAPPLRLAPPPLSGAMGTDLMQTFFYRFAAPASEGEGRGGAQANALAKALEPRPLIKALVDGSVDLSAGRHADAERKLSDCVRAAAAANDPLAEAACANNLGLALAAQGRLEPARAELERALGLYREEHSPPRDGESPLGTGMSAVLGFLGRFQGTQPQSPDQKAAPASGAPAGVRQAMLGQWRSVEQVDTVRGIERTSLNLGNVALLAGRLADAERLLGSALNDRASGEPSQCSAAAAVDWGRLRARLGHPVDRAATRLPPDPKPQVAGRRDDKSRGKSADESFVEMGVIHVATATAGSSLATEARSAATTAPPSGAPAQTAIAYSEAGGRFDDAVMTAMFEQATRAPRDSPAQAEWAWKRLAIRAAAGRRPDLEFAARVALVKLYAERSQPKAAIYHAKRAINLAQSERDALEDRSPTRESRRAFARDRQQVYVTLAEMLLDAQRLQEAESAMQLLKEDEGQQFVDRPSALGRIELTGPELTLQQLEDDAIRGVRDAEKSRVDAVGHLAFGAGALRSMDAAKLESTRLEQALGLQGLPAMLQRSPLPGGDGMMQQMGQQVRDFLLGPGRLERFMSHLQDDLPSFRTPASASDRARLDDISRHLHGIQADLAAALQRTSTDDNPVGVSFSRSGNQIRETPPRQVEWSYAIAETYEHLWRSIHTADVIEARYAEPAPESSLPAQFDPNQREGGAADESKALLARQSLPTAVLYYLPSTQRLDVLVVSASGRQHFRLAVGTDEVNASIDAFIDALRNPNRDPRPAATAMYRELFAPVEQAVASSGARVLALSLSGRLRFVPFGAFNDGNGWLVERYAFAIHPGAQLAGRLKPATANWRIAAFGASRGNAKLLPLPAVRSEIASVARQGNGGRGALPGDAWLDDAFTAQRLRAALGGGAQVVHIASHFNFVGGDAAESYLLLGDGSTLSLRDLAGPQYRFDRTELVTLSACTTGLSASDSYGQEVDGLAALLMGQGAQSVLASLWDVHDEKTSLLMGSLYRLRESEHLSRVVALQQAQVAMIHSTGANSPAADAGRTTRNATRVYLPGDAEGEAGNPVVPASVGDQGSTHPFYWAPFVLMGNWL